MVPDCRGPTGRVSESGARVSQAGTGVGRDAARSAFKALPDSVQREVLRQWYRYGPRSYGETREAHPLAEGMAVGNPDFVGIGVPKAGTTWWFSLVAAHPDIYVEHQKELMYFNQRVFDHCAQDGGADDVFEAYRQWFPRPEGTKTGEWTPNYLYAHELPSLLRKVAPACKVMVLLRDPVERYRSHVSIRLSPGRMRIHRLLALDRGYYSAALQPWERVFSPSEMLVLQFEACRRSPEAHLGATYRFLGVDDSFVPDDLRLPVNKTAGKRPLPPDVERVLARLYEADVLALADRYPQIDLNLWPNFAHLAGRS
jgi:hypothetical protein